MRIRLLTFEQLNARSPYAVGRDFRSAILYKKGNRGETETYDYWACALGRWYILVKRKPIEL